MAILQKVLGLLPVLAVAIALSAAAQFQSGILYGQVVDAAGGFPIPQAGVFIEATSLLSSTNSDGFYLFGNIPYGTYQVTASAEGYVPQTLDVVIEADSTVLNFNLQQISTGLTLTSPQSEETYYAGSIMPIRWTTQFPYDSEINIYIYRASDEESPTIFSVQNETDGGSFDFQIPADYPPGSDYYIFVEGFNGSFFSDQAVVTIAQPSITVTQPTGRERFSAGEILSVRWQSTGIEGEVGIDLLQRLDNTTTVVYRVVDTITESTSDDGTFDWTIPSSYPGGDFFRVRVYSLANPTFFGQSGDFSIDPLEEAQIIVDPTSVDFGTVEVGQTSAERTVTIFNEGGQVLTGAFRLTGDETNSFEITTEGRSFELGGGNELDLEAVFRPTVVGYSQAVLEITHNAVNMENPVEVLLQGTGQLDQLITVTRPAAGERFTARETLPVRWESTGIESEVGIDLLQRRSDASDVVYDVVETLAENTANDGVFDWPIPDTYPGGDFFRVRVYSLPDPFLQGQSGDFGIDSLAQSLLAVTPADIDFGVVDVGQRSPERTVTITNEGELALEGAVRLTGSDAGAFEITRGGGDFELDGGEAFEVEVVFRPATEGEMQAVLEITHNASNAEGPEAVALQGTARVQTAIAITRPASGERFTAGTLEDIRWTSQGEIPTVDIFLIRNETVELEIASDIDNSGSFAWQLPATLPEANDYRIRIVQSDNPQVWVFSEGTFAITSLAIDVSYTQTSNGLQVEVNTNDDFNPSDRLLFFRRGGEFGEASWQQIQIGGDNGTFSASIPSSFVTERGVDFYVRLSRGETTLTFPRNLQSEGPEHVRVQVTESQAPFPLSPRTYRMISVPMELSENGAPGVLEDDFGPYDKNRWRLLRWISNEEEYDELPEMETPFLPGTAFWLITDTGTSFDTGDALSVDASLPFDLRLEPGWNQIADPFAFSVAWPDVISWNAGLFDGNFEAFVGPLVFFDGSEMRYDTLAQVLRPWEGYFLFNATNRQVTIQIPPREATDNPGIASRQISTSVTSNVPYTIQLIATVPGLQLKDTQNWVGFYDDEDVVPVQYLEAPGIGPQLRLSLIDRETRYARLLKSAAEGQMWDVEIGVEGSPGISAQGKRVQVQLAELGVRPEGMQLQVLDQDNGKRLPLEENGFEVEMGDHGDIRHLQIVLGTPDFVEGHLEGIPQASLSSTLEQNYPNPFTGSTSIGYRIEEQSRVLIEIFNALGQRIHTLVNADMPAGKYVVDWDGRTSTGSLASSGVYLCRIRAGAFTATKTMLLIR